MCNAWAQVAQLAMRDAITHYSLITTHYSLPTHHSLLTTHNSLLTHRVEISWDWIPDLC